MLHIIVSECNEAYIIGYKTQQMQDKWDLLGSELQIKSLY